MNILITGIDGLLGTNLCRWLKKNTEHTIIGIDNGGNSLNYAHPHVYRLEDIRNDSIDEIFAAYKPAVCFHFAAYAAEGRSNFIRKYIHNNNTVGTANVINACVNHDCKIVFTSSVAIYSGIPPFDEDTIPNPIDEYGLSKYMSEKSIEIAGKTNNLEWTIIRPRNVYGEFQNMFDPARNLFGIWLYKMFNKLPLTIYGDGNHKRAFTYIEDILEPMYNSIKYDRQIFNLGSSNVYSINQAAEIFCEVTGYDKIVHTEPREEVPEAFCNTLKSEQLLDYKDKTTLYEGLKKMYTWAKQQKMQALTIPPPLEIIKNIHSSLL